MGHLQARGNFDSLGEINGPLPGVLLYTAVAVCGNGREIISSLAAYFHMIFLILGRIFRNV